MFFRKTFEKFSKSFEKVLFETKTDADPKKRMKNKRENKILF